ncbi:unnamed protein product [Microthlaspi erraticum]|uniref:START domain-containing protein n=1 Tax=Microthlaspi erraticum TaxID=1685480 RepID=A0A6D2JT33_9BRAS|nr:unnamed protein product [Microthlaspi erraticum]
MLKAENHSLKMENYNLRSNPICSSCDGSSDKLRLENSRLRQELDLLRSIASLFDSPPSPQDTSFYFSETDNNNVTLISEEEKAAAMDLAVSCVQELEKMCETIEPLWNKKMSVSLNEEEYKKMFQWPPMDDGRFRREASRANEVVLMNSITLVNTFLDADKWSEMFCPIVSRAKTIQIISSGVSGASGSLLLMYAELQGLSPMVPTREGYFLRYAEQKAEESKWMIVDFPIKKASATAATDQYRRKPSGCIIQDIPNGYSQVTWVEHVEVEEKHVLHEVVREYVRSGVAFGAERWLSVLKRQCERMASLMATDITDLGVIPSVDARRNLMRLSQTMVKSFCYGQAFSESTMDAVRVTRTRRKVCGGVVLCAVSTKFLPFSHHQVFDLLRDDHVLSQVANNSPDNEEMMLQETCTDNSGGLVVYSTVDFKAAMNGEDTSSIPILPLGFSIVPVNPPEGISVYSPSCLLTVGIQFLASNVATARLELSNVNDRIFTTLKLITSSLESSGSSAVPKQEISW